MEKRENNAYTSDYYTQYNNIITSGEARIPICFCIDVSGSMNFITNRSEDFTYYDGPSYSLDGNANVRNIIMKPGKVAHNRIDEVKRVLKNMLTKMREIPILRNSAVVSIVTFSRFADCIIEFSELNNIQDRYIDYIEPEADVTNASKGIQLSLERLDSIMSIIRNAGNESYKPVFVFMTDGNPTDGESAKNAGYDLRQRSEDNKLNVVPIAIGADRENEVWLKQLSKDGRVFHMVHEEEFDEVFNKIKSRIHNSAVVISVDENLVDTTSVENKDNSSDEIASSQYGTTTSIEEMSDFLRELGEM